MTLLTETGFLQSESGIPSLLQETRVGGHIGSTDYPQTRLERSVLSTRVWGKLELGRQKGTVHTYCPHVCGGSTLSGHVLVPARVLSTRVWGKPRAIIELGRQKGTVHTCVGEA